MKKNKEKTKIVKQSSLPKNRKEQFFDIFKNNFSLFTTIGFTLVVISIPLIISMMFENQFIYGFLADGSYINEAGFTDEGFSLYMTNTLIFGGINTIIYMLMFLIIGGLLRIYRQFYWSAHVDFWHDLIKGIKNNYKNSLLFGLIYGLSRLVFSLLSISNAHFVVSTLIYGINFVFIYPLILVGMVYTTLYNASFGKTIYHSLLLYIKKILYIIPILIIFIALPFIKYLPLERLLLKIVLLIVIMFVLMPIYLLFTYGMELHCFDEQINKLHYPELENKGLSIYE